MRFASTPGAATRADFRLEVIGRGDHFVGVLGGRAADDRGVAVAGDRGAGTRRHDAAHRGVGGEDAFDPRDGAAECRVGHGQFLRVDGDLQRVGAGAAEVGVELFADLDRFRAVGLPAGARERGLDPRRQHAEADGDHRPADEDGAAVGGGEAPEPPDRPQGAHRSQAASTPK